MNKKTLRRFSCFSFGGILGVLFLTGTVVGFDNGQQPVQKEEQVVHTVSSLTSLPTYTPTPTSSVLVQKVEAKAVTKPAPTITSTPEITEQSPTHVPSAVSITPAEIQTTPYDVWFDQYSTEYGVDREVLVMIARCESGFNTSAQNGPYLGMYQFHAGTWHSTRTAMGENPDITLRNNPEEAIKTAAWKIAQGGIGAWPVCGKG